VRLAGTASSVQAALLLSRKMDVSAIAVSVYLYHRIQKRKKKKILGTSYFTNPFYEGHVLYSFFVNLARKEVLPFHENVC
jgi:hypothetical protein